MHTILVVLFKTKFSNSQTLTSLLHNIQTPDSRYRLYIWDNSPADFIQGQDKFFSELVHIFDTVIYHRSENNLALSKIYNSVARETFSDGAKLLTIFDQDSTLSVDFLLQIGKIGEKDLLILPRVISSFSNRMISPRRQDKFFLFKRKSFDDGFKIDDAGIYDSEFLFAVGSGMTIPKELWFTGLTFDENVSFYGVDAEFCNDYQNYKEEFIVADVSIRHDVSVEAKESAVISEWRYQNNILYLEYQLRKHSWYPYSFIATYIRFRKLCHMVKSIKRNYFF